MAARSDFPFFDENQNLIYLDNAATTLLPQVVLDTISNYYTKNNSNIGRGSYSIAERNLAEIEKVRAKTAAFLNAENHSDIVFSSGCTHSINIVARSFLEGFIKRTGKRKILIGKYEHNSNYLVWQALAKELDLELKVIDYTSTNEVDDTVALGAFTYSSNVVADKIDLKAIIKEIHSINGVVLIDAAQAIAHEQMDVKALDCDFLAFSTHKAYSAMGCGILYVKNCWTSALTPFFYGGGIVRGKELKEFPYCMEGGTLNNAAILAWGSAMDYLAGIGWSYINQKEQKLKNLLIQQLMKIEGIQFYGLHDSLSPVVSFSIEGVNDFDVATLLGPLGVCLRSGNLCTPLTMRSLGISSCLRVSPAFYNTEEEIDEFYKKISMVLKVVRH